MSTISKVSKNFAQTAEPSMGDFQPLKIVEVELSRPLPEIDAGTSMENIPYRRAMVLVRLHSHPIGWIEVPLEGVTLSAENLGRIIWRELSSVIVDHLLADGMQACDSITAAGLPTSGVPACLREREQFLADAPFVSVIIPTSERADRLAICLRSLLAMDYGQFEIVVVDNVPKTSATFNLIRDEFGEDHQIRYVREDRSGSAIARNRGLAVATGEIVAFTDDDIVVDKYWLTELVKGFSFGKDVACVTGLILPLELETQAQLWFEQYGGFSKGFARKVYDLKENRQDNPLYPYNMGSFGSGNSMAFKKSVLRSLGNFDPMLGNGTPTLGGVDVEAFFRVVINGYQLVYEPASIVHHLHRRDYDRLKKQIYGYGVGLTAPMTKAMVRNPRLFLDLARKMPAGVRYALSVSSPLNSNKARDYPEELTRLDRLGMLYGPIAYFRSWWWWKVSLPRSRHLHQGAGDRQGAR